MRYFGIVNAVKPRGYGFIRRGPTEPDIFFHFSECSDKKNGFPVFTRVEFSIGTWRDGRPMAVNVAALPDDSPVSEGAAHVEN